MESSGTRLCPPASTFAPGCSASAARASSRVRGRRKANGAGFKRLPTPGTQVVFVCRSGPDCTDGTRPVNATPAGGLDDRHLGAGGKFRDGRLDWQLAWHDYRADSGGGYGREWNAALGFPVGKRLKGLLKVADYRADGFARDTAKAWLQLEWTR